MAWVQALCAFVVWIAYLFWNRRAFFVEPNWIASRSFRTRFAVSVFVLGLSLVVLLGGLWTIQRIAPARDGQLHAAGLVLAALLGIVFLRLQVLAFAISIGGSRTGVTPDGRFQSNRIPVHSKEGETQ